ncbi:MAG: CoA-binding protein [Anaerovorax sp.]|nr:CoA-binding protein [Anaerovorax sp.]
MDMLEILDQKTFVVVGDTLNEKKYAYKIKSSLLERGYKAFGVGKEKKSINEIAEEIDIIDLCINPIDGLKIIQECEKTFKCIVIQPHADNDALLSYLNEQNIPYIQGCLLAA